MCRSPTIDKPIRPSPKQTAPRSDRAQVIYRPVGQPRCYRSPVLVVLCYFSSISQIGTAAPAMTQPMAVPPSLLDDRLCPRLLSSPLPRTQRGQRFIHCVRRAIGAQRQPRVESHDSSRISRPPRKRHVTAVQKRLEVNPLSVVAGYGVHFVQHAVNAMCPADPRNARTPMSFA
jgi:hypothetical protein